MLKFKIQSCPLAAYYCTTLHSLYNTSQLPLERKTHMCGQEMRKLQAAIQHTTTHCNRLQQTATHRITLHLRGQGNAGTKGENTIHCNTLQHAAFV